jgi:hypothetical protein
MFFFAKTRLSEIFLTVASELEESKQFESFGFHILPPLAINCTLARLIVAVAHDTSRACALREIGIGGMCWSDAAGAVTGGVFKIPSSVQSVYTTSSALESIMKNDGGDHPFVPQMRLSIVIQAGTYLSQFLHFAARIGVIGLDLVKEGDFLTEDKPPPVIIPSLRELTIHSISSEANEGAAEAIRGIIRSCQGLNSVRLAYYHGRLQDTLGIVEEISRLKSLRTIYLNMMTAEPWEAPVMKAFMNTPSLEVCFFVSPGLALPVKEFACTHPRVRSIFKAYAGIYIPAANFATLKDKHVYSPCFEREIKEKLEFRDKVVRAVVACGLGDLSRDFMEYLT